MSTEHPTEHPLTERGHRAGTEHTEHPRKKGTEHPTERTELHRAPNTTTLCREWWVRCGSGALAQRTLATATRRRPQGAWHRVGQGGEGLNA
jgi:hypothetical protein